MEPIGTSIAAPDRPAPATVEKPSRQEIRRAPNGRPTLKPASGLGLAALLLPLSSLGLLVLASADNAARDGSSWAEPLYWAGVFVLFVPLAGGAIRASASRAERLVLVTALGVGLYLMKIVHSPDQLDFGDEFMHLRTAQDISASTGLFGANPFTVISPLYPGLEIVTVALAKVTGLHLSTAGMIVVGAARLTIALCLFHLFEAIADSPRVAALGAVIYMTNPNFGFEAAQFSYESLGVPLLVLTLYLATRAAQVRGSRAFAGLALLAIAATITTHHAASYALAVMLTLWTVVGWVLRGRPRAGRRITLRVPAYLAPLAVAGCAVWLLFVAPETPKYLGTDPSNGAGQLFDLIFGKGHARHIFANPVGVAPLRDRLLGISAASLILVGLPFGIWAIARRLRRNAEAVTLALLACGYPLALSLRLTSEGQETANRASEYLFLGIGLALAVWGVGWARRAGRISSRVVPVALLCVLLAGGLVTGWAYWARLPGKYLVGGGSRSVNAESKAAAAWMFRVRGGGNRMAADTTPNSLLLGTSDQRVVGAGKAGETRVWPLFFASDLGPRGRNIIRRARIEYVVIDRRLALSLPYSGRYISDGEPTRRLTRHGLTKFDRVDRASRIFDSGSVQIYDVRPLERGGASR